MWCAAPKHKSTRERYALSDVDLLPPGTAPMGKAAARFHGPSGLRRVMVEGGGEVNSRNHDQIQSAATSNCPQSLSPSFTPLGDSTRTKQQPGRAMDYLQSLLSLDGIAIANYDQVLAGREPNRLAPEETRLLVGPLGRSRDSGHPDCRFCEHCQRIGRQYLGEAQSSVIDGVRAPGPCNLGWQHRSAHERRIREQNSAGTTGSVRAHRFGPKYVAGVRRRGRDQIEIT